MSGYFGPDLTCPAYTLYIRHGTPLSHLHTPPQAPIHTTTSPFPTTANIYIIFLFFAEQALIAQDTRFATDLIPTADHFGHAHTPF